MWSATNNVVSRCRESGLARFDTHTHTQQQPIYRSKFNFDNNCRVL